MKTLVIRLTLQIVASLLWLWLMTLAKARTPLKYRCHFWRWSNDDQNIFKVQAGNNKGGKYHCTVDLLFDCFGISCMTTDNFCFYLQNRLIQTSQTGGQWYNDTSPFRISWCRPLKCGSDVHFFQKFVSADGCGLGLARPNPAEPLDSEDFILGCQNMHKLCQMRSWAVLKILQFLHNLPMGPIS